MQQNRTAAPEPRRVALPMTPEALGALHAGDTVLLSGVAYTARDAAHQRMARCLETGQPLPFALQGQTIFYLGPAAARPGRVIGAAGPTSSYRMDAYTPALLQRGLQGMIGKGPRSKAVADAMKQYGAVYFAAVGGTAALLCRHIVSCEVVAYPDLGPEAVRRLVLEDLPAVVALDRYGQDQYRLGPRQNGGMV